MAANEAQFSKIDTKPPVHVKSMRDGLLFLLDENCEFTALVAHLTELLHGDTQAVFDGPEVKVAVDLGARPLSPAESRELLDIFMRRGNFLLSEWGENTNARKLLQQPRTRLPGQHIYKGTVRAGQRLVFDGDVMVVGDVNPGGEVIATGDIYVFGKLAGIAHSGASGDEKAIIAAVEFVPMQLRIGTIVSRAPEERGKALQTFMEFAYVRDYGMAVDKMQFAAAIRQRHHALAPTEGEVL